MLLKNTKIQTVHLQFQCLRNYIANKNKSKDTCFCNLLTPCWGCIRKINKHFGNKNWHGITECKFNEKKSEKYYAVKQASCKNDRA